MLLFVSSSRGYRIFPGVQKFNKPWRVSSMRARWPRGIPKMKCSRGFVAAPHPPPENEFRARSQICLRSRTWCMLGGVSFVSCSSNAGYIILVHKYHRQFRCCYWWRARHVGVYSWSCLRMAGLACWMNKLIDANSLMQNAVYLFVPACNLFVQSIDGCNSRY